VLKVDAIKAVEDFTGEIVYPGIFEIDEGEQYNADMYPKRRRVVEDGFAQALTGWCSYDRGPGGAFQNDPICFNYGKKLLLIWRGGLDI